MKITPFSVALHAAVGVGLLTVACARQPSAPSVQPGESMDDAIARVQNNQTLSPQDKVKEIDAIQRQFSGGQPPRKHKKDL